jgi:hypothetical protein
MRDYPTPVGGPIVTRPFKILAALAAIALALLAWRFVFGLGSVTAMNDGYPWGLWIAFDVVVGTALATGGYAVAILVYVLNKGRYHPLVRSALVTSALGYTLGAIGVVIDLGRFWSVWKVPIYFWNWNLNSILLEVALCISLYVLVLWVEVSPSFLENWKRSEHAAGSSFRGPGDPAAEDGLPVPDRARAPATDDAPVIARQPDAAGRAAAARALEHAAAAAALPGVRDGDGLRGRGARIDPREPRLRSARRNAAARRTVDRDGRRDVDLRRPPADRRARAWAVRPGAGRRCLQPAVPHRDRSVHRADRDAAPPADGGCGPCTCSRPRC